MKARSLASLVTLSVGLLLTALPAAAKIDMVVMEARGVKLQQGQIIDGSANLTLTEGQQVSLMMQDGRVIKVKGPSDKPPAPPEASATANVELALQLLITQQSSRERAGVIRGGPGLVVPPEPWVVDISSDGLRCLQADSSITLWRPNASTSMPIEVTPTDRSWKATVTWEKGSEYLALGHSVPVRRRTAYVVRSGNKEVNITLVSLPTSLTNDAMRAAFMIDNGCDAQAKALFTKAGLSAR
jgi:hypothetical protein